MPWIWLNFHAKPCALFFFQKKKSVHKKKNVEGDGGAIGLTEDSLQLLRWMIAGPEIAGAIAEFENESASDPSKQSRGPDLLHHEQVNHFQCTFKTQVQSLVEVFTECGNPFIDESGDLLVLDTSNIMTPEVVSTVSCIETLGQEQYKLYCKERLDTKVKLISDVIPRNKLSLFRSPVKRLKTKHQITISTVKQNCALFSQLYISSQVRNGDLDNFLRHENLPHPPALSEFGKLRFGVKSDLTKMLESHTLSSNSTLAPEVDALVIDGAALVNQLRPNGACKTFQDYAQQCYIPYIMAKLKIVLRIDVVWDIYLPNSIKSTARDKRGSGVRRRVQPDVNVPTNWA